MALVLACWPGKSDAQSFRDIIFACADEQRSLEEKRRSFSDSSWVEFTSDSTAHKLVRSLLFLTNVDATKPETWSDTYAWANDLAQADKTAPRYAFALKTKVVLQKNSTGSDACFVVRNDEYLDTLKEKYYAQAKIHQNGPRRYLFFQNEFVIVTATEWQTKFLSKARRYSGGYVFAASFVAKQKY